MSEAELQQLSELYDDYFSVEHAININVNPHPAPLPDEPTFVSLIPEPFLLATQTTSLNLSALRSLNRLGELAEELANYLQQQAKKMDLLLHYLLQQQDSADCRFITTSYGGSGCSYLAQQPVRPLDLLQLKLFFADDNGAVFCFAQVLSCEPADDKWLVKVVFVRIRDEDRELIVRASLHQQSRQLKRKAEMRQQASDT